MRSDDIVGLGKALHILFFPLRINDGVDVKTDGVARHGREYWGSD